MAKNQIDLLSLFSQVTKTMEDNKSSLNKADTYNHDHGDNMVEIFEVITQAMKEKKSADPADQLEYAASLLRDKTKSGSSKLYAQGLDEASKQMTGKDLDTAAIMSMVQTVLGAGEAPASKPAASGDMLGSLLGSLDGGQDDGVDLGDLLGAGMSFLSAKQSGKSNLEAITGALVSGSQMASSPYREQSSQLVTSTLLKGLTSMLSK